jgi:hypothetical protein
LIISARRRNLSTRHSSQALSSQHAGASEDEAEIQASQPGPSRRRHRTVLTRRQTENVSTGSHPRGIPATRSVSLGNLRERLSIKNTLARLRCV